MNMLQIGGCNMKGVKQVTVTVFGLSLILLFMMITACSTSKTPVNANSQGIALKGYDTVAYFTVGKPVKGDRQFSHKWQGATWLFSSKEHLNLFAAAPEKYAPQYGGY
jgi:YHS domain-containing protein